MSGANLATAGSDDNLRAMVVVVIPALDPPASLVDLVATLAVAPGIGHVVVVDDGSDPRHRGLFDEVGALPKTTMLRHARNQGKGAALKTAFAYVSRCAPNASRIVTADADGQHSADDILRVTAAAQAHPDALVLGSRCLGPTAPLRSRIGNRLTRLVYGVLVGQWLADTQTGLRAFPPALLPAFGAAEGRRYDYEMQVLIQCRQRQVPVAEVPVARRYVDGNRGSHFRPLRDSLRIYSVLGRFAILSLASAGLDNLVFAQLLAVGAAPAIALGLARAASASVNYPLATRWVFRDAAPQPGALTPYLVLVAVNLTAAGFGTVALAAAGLSPLLAKMAWETLWFLPNFVLQRDWVFRGSPRLAGTDWTAYYSSVPFTARLTRRYTTRRLVQAIRRSTAARIGSIAELGGAASCFLDSVCRALGPDTYLIVDNNQFGLSRLASWTPPRGAATTLELIDDDVRRLAACPRVDIVFSVGLVEHFAPDDTRRAIAAHFALARPGGVVVVTYPTPTRLYLATRGVLEALRLWRFPDERPLHFAEVAHAVGTEGAVMSRRILWPLLLTQEMVVFAKR